VSWAIQTLTQIYPSVTVIVSNRAGDPGLALLVVGSLRFEKKEDFSVGKIRRLVLDTLKPHDPSIIKLSQSLSELPGVEAVNISIYEMDRKVENAKITVEGADLIYEAINQIIIDAGGAVHSIDEVVAGKMIIDDSVTPQDL
jgi:hypothetical protein